MALYGQVLYGQALYGAPSLPPAAGSGPTTFVPSYAPATAPVVPRGGSQLADIGVTLTPGSNGAALTLGRDARGGLGLVTGGDRLVSRVTRALLTERATRLESAG